MSSFATVQQVFEVLSNSLDLDVDDNEIFIPLAEDLLDYLKGIQISTLDHFKVSIMNRLTRRVELDDRGYESIIDGLWMIRHQPVQYLPILGRGRPVQHRPILTRHPPVIRGSVEQRRVSYLETQNQELHMSVPETSDEGRVAYYQSMFGKDYGGIEFFDAIALEEVKISDYINESLDNIVFIILSDPCVVFASRRSVIREQMALYDCDDKNKRYISLANIGYHGTGVANYDAVIVTVINSNYQIFALKTTGINTNKLITHEIRHYEDTIIGGLHCQEGSQMPYYLTYIPGI